jgi:hypothetical protein
MTEEKRFMQRYRRGRVAEKIDIQILSAALYLCLFG